MPPIMTSERVKRRIERLLDQADAALEDQNYQAALQAAKAALGFDPGSAEATAFVEAAQQALAVVTANVVDPRLSQVSAPESAEPPPAGSTEETITVDPTSFAGGRYQVSKFLGEGGKKRVYQAHDTLLDREVAFAVIKTEGFDKTSKERITREAQAMGRLGVHPNIVAVLDLGQEDDGTPYMVTELMGGGDVEGLLEAAVKSPLPTGESLPRTRYGGEGEGEATSTSIGPSRTSGRGPAGTGHGPAASARAGLPLDRTIEIGKAVCEGLEFAHARGIVHRDLKPGNVWLTEDGIAKIGDFGLAVMTDRSRLTREGMMVGTVSYMPPEQATGGEITPKADLYSLGAMLYEMVTGRPPFLGDDEIAIIGQHINTPPVAPTWHNDNCPRPLEALIMRLLGKDPAERPESAQDVFNALDAIDLLARGDTIEQDQTSLESLAGGVFVGRQAEMNQLKAALEDVLGGRGRLVTLVGEPGIGKTRTSEELATYAGLRGAQVLWGRCYEGGGAPPYWPWVQAIRSYVREIEPEELRRQLGSSASVVAEIVTEVKDRLPDLQPPPQMDDPDSARFRLFDSIASFLISVSQSRPLVIVLDDLHWSDRPTLAFLEFVAREIGQSRVLLLCTYRDMELNRRHPLSVTLGELARDRLYERVLLRGLSETDVARFIEIAAGTRPPAELSATVHRHTEGNPLFVTEVVRELVQSGELAEKSSSSHSTWSVRIPEGVREVIGRRLDRLSDRTNEALTIAAVIGRQFSMGALRGLVEDTSESQLLDVLDEALAARVIEELTSSAGEYQFTHALIQDTLTGELSLTRRVRLHARIAETLERLYGDHADDHAVELAHHFSEAEAVADAEKLVHYCRIAGEQALASIAMEEALVHFECALAARGDDPIDDEIAALRIGRGRANGALRNAGEAVRDLTAAFDYYEKAGRNEDAVTVARYPVTAVAESGSGMLYVQLRALSLVEKGSLDEGRLLVPIGTVMGATTGPGFDSGLEALDKALSIAQENGDQLLELQARYATVHIQHEAFRTDRSRSEYLERALKLTESVDDPLTEAAVRQHMGDDLANAGHPREAFEQYEAGIAAAQRAGYLELISTVCRMAGELASDLGEWERARQFYARGQRAWADDGRVIARRALVEFEVGDLVEGEKLFARLQELRDPTAATAATARKSLPAGTHRLTASLPHAIRITDSDELRIVARSAAEEVLKSIVGPAVEFDAKLTLAGVLAAAGDVADAERLYEEISDVPGRDRELAWAAAALGRHDDALARFETVMESARRPGYRPVLAWACEGSAEVLLDRDEPGDREKAIVLQDEALTITRDLTMRPLTERILARREFLRA